METETWSECMSEYRRFVSYIYEYRSGKKEGNCGYVKVEVRNGICRLRLHLQPGRKAGDTLQVYGFVRGQSRIFGSLLGSVNARNNMYEFQLNSPASAIGSSGYAVDDLRGIWLRGGESENYITVWDDEPVLVEQFSEQPKAAPGEISERPEAALGQLSEQPEAAVRQLSEQPEEMIRESSGQPGVEREAQSEDMGTQSPDAQPEDTGAQLGDTSVQGQEANAVTPVIPDETMDDNACGREREEWTDGSLWARWEKFLAHYTHLHPFADDEITQCICIALKDLSFLKREEWQFSQNTFVRQGYMRYHHLLLGCHKNGRFVLAVPGTDDAQEKHMARMYGFLYYKETPSLNADCEVRAADERTTVGPKGYWYCFLKEVCPAF